MFIACGPCMPNCPICMLCRTKNCRIAMKKKPKMNAQKPSMMYAIGDAKYDRNSFWAIARMLRIDGLLRDGRFRRFVGREGEEDVFEAGAHRPELQQPPTLVHDGAREIAADVAARLAVDGVAHLAVAPVRFDDAPDAGHAPERVEGGAFVRAVNLDVHRFRSAQPGDQVLRRVDGDDLSAVDDDDALARLRDLRQDVRAQ